MAIFTSENRAGWQELADKLAVDRPSKGKRVRVTSGTHKGKEGVVTWHGKDKFASERYYTDALLVAREMFGTSGFRCRVSTEEEAFFVNADKVEIIHNC